MLTVIYVVHVGPNAFMNINFDVLITLRKLIY